MANANSKIDQVYGTHCTYGTSALERRVGDGADDVFGYNIRAGSLEGSELRTHFLAISRYLYYKLPSDGSDDLVLRLDPRHGAAEILLLSLDVRHEYPWTDLLS